MLKYLMLSFSFVFTEKSSMAKITLNEREVVKAVLIFLVNSKKIDDPDKVLSENKQYEWGFAKDRSLTVWVGDKTEETENETDAPPYKGAGSWK